MANNFYAKPTVFMGSMTQHFAYSLYSTPEYLFLKMEHQFMLDENMALFIVVEDILTRNIKDELIKP
uniref:Uncharacterized protein n=1 Tax=Romanomermis culicivorax TaxID=13658 RepID=A0A915LAF4_ROMCU